MAKSQTSRRPSIDPVIRENQMISLATAEAEKRLKNGTASSQIICHYLNLATTKMQLEKQILENQAALLEAKTEAIHEAKKNDELYAKAIEAMRRYSGNSEPEDDEDIQ